MEIDTKPSKADAKESVANQPQDVNKVFVVDDAEDDEKVADPSYLVLYNNASSIASDNESEAGEALSVAEGADNELMIDESKLSLVS